MTLRRELNPPPIDEELVARLAPLAAEIDGARPGEWEDELDEFNRLSPKALTFLDFQGISGGEEHDVFIRRLLATHNLPRISNLSRDDIVAAFERILDADCQDHQRWFLIDTLALNLGDSQISDLIYWPGEYFGDGDNSREMTAMEMADAALARQVERNK
jgi:hypothetical protein